jgi:hypothetical protein
MSNQKLQILKDTKNNLFYTKTEYPKIYMSTNWGHFKLIHPWEFIETKNIMENRNQFIKDYNIKKVKRETVKIYRFIKEEEKKLPLDHTEIYITNDKKLIIITSPYKHVDPLDFEFWGWTMIYNLYSNDAYTFIKEIKL